MLSRHGDQGTGVAVPSLLDSLRQALGEVDYQRGCDIIGGDGSGIAAAVKAAQAAEVAIVAVGDLAGLFGRGTSGEGCDAPDLSLPGLQAELVEAVLDSGTPVVLVVVSGRPYALGDFADRCAAIVQAFFPGEEGGPALTRILTGAVEPSGRLPVGIPRDAGGQPGTYLSAPLGLKAEGISNLDPTPLFPFGHGLSYSRVAYGELTVSSTELPTDGALELAIQVHNVGDRPCDEVVQLYFSDHVAQVVRPTRELIGYARVTLGVGQGARIEFTVHADRTGFTGLAHRRIVEPGGVTFAVGRSSADLVSSVDVQLVGSERELRGPRVMVTPVRITRLSAGSSRGSS